MFESWITYAAVLFGIAVAVTGVIAYLRMIKNAKHGERSRTQDPEETKS